MPNEIYHKSNWGNANAEGFGDVYFDAAATNKLYNHSDYYENSDGTDKILRDLSNKASITLTPTAYSDGSLNTVIPPYKILPTELVTNGDFSNGTTNWTLDDASNGSISVVDGKLEIVSNGGAGYPVVKQGISTSIGKKYSVTFSVTNNTTGFWFRVSQSDGGLGGDTTFYANDKTSSINFKGEFTAISTTSYLKIFAEQNDAGSFEIDNISIKEIQEADFDFSRGSSATRVNEKGLIESIASGLPRIDFTDGTGSLLLEPQRTNLLTYSEDFSQWTIQSGTTVTTNTTETLSPSGEYNSSKIVGNGTSGILKASVSSSGGINTKSIYIKGTQNGQVVYLKDPNQTVNNKALTLSTNWQRYTLTESQSSDFGIWISNIPTSGIYMWGAQVELGSYATSYIVSNSGSTTTRSADVANNSGNADLFNDSEGVLYAEISALANYNTQRWLSLSDSTHSNVVKIGLLNSATDFRFAIEVRSGGSTQAFMTYNFGAVTPTMTKIAIKFKQNDFALWVNGVERATDTSGNTPTGLSELSFDRGDGGQDFEGNVKCVAVFKEALTDAELQQLTS